MPLQSQRPLDNPPIPVQLKLAASWASLMFLVIYVDYYHLYKPGTIEHIQGGRVFEFDISSGLLTGFLALIAIPSLMIMLSAALPPRANRTVNLVVAALYIPVMIFNAAGETWLYASFYALSIGLEVLILVLILRWAWRWPRATDAGASLPANARQAAV